MIKYHYLLSEGEYFMKRFNAFTLAEVLITLAIIGVVAALTIPTLMVKTNEKTWESADKTFRSIFEEGLRLFRIKENIAGYASTKDFVVKLSEQIKINKICDSSNLNECFADKFDSDSEEMETANFSSSKNFGKDDWDSEIVGVIFNNGVSALIAYDKNCKTENYYTGTPTKCVGLLYDINGKSNPNSVKKDIKTYGDITLKNKLVPDLPQGTGFDFVWTDDTYKYFKDSAGNFLYCEMFKENIFNCTTPQGGNNNFRKNESGWDRRCFEPTGGDEIPCS